MWYEAQQTPPPCCDVETSIAAPRGFSELTQSGRPVVTPHLH